MGDVNLEIKLNNINERVIKIEESGGSGGDGYITSVSNDFNVVNKKLSLSNDVTTKLSKVDDKIDKPASATDGQVLTYNGTSNEWEAQDSKGSSITEPTELEKGIIGGDEWVAQSYTKGATVIYNNKIYYCKADCSASNLPSEPDSNYWEETSLSTLKGAISSLEEKGNYEVIAEIVGTNNQVFNGIDLSKYSLIGIAMTYNKGILNCSTFPTKFLFERPSTNGYYSLNGKDYAGIKQISGNLTNASFVLALNKSDNVYKDFGALLFGIK